MKKGDTSAQAVHAFDQLSGAARGTAQMVGAYYNELVSLGAPPDHALQLTLRYQRRILDSFMPPSPPHAAQ